MISLVKGLAAVKNMPENLLQATLFKFDAGVQKAGNP